jgi:hypothetical protein
VDRKSEDPSTHFSNGLRNDCQKNQSCHKQAALSPNAAKREESPELFFSFGLPIRIESYPCGAVWLAILQSYCL